MTTESYVHVDFEHPISNWKLISENQIDSYHGISLHSSYFRYAMKRSGETPSSRPSSIRGNPGGSEMATARSKSACAPGGQSPLGAGIWCGNKADH